MILRKDAEGDYVVDIETPENRKLLLPCQITSISPNKENKSLFTLTYRVRLFVYNFCLKFLGNTK